MFLKIEETKNKLLNSNKTVSETAYKGIVQVVTFIINK